MKEKEAKVYRLMKEVIIASKHNVADYLESEGDYGPPPSSTNNSDKILNNLVALGKLEKGKGFYRMPGCKSEFGDHAKALTNILIQILKRYPDSIIIREKLIQEINLIPDAIILLVDGDKGGCIVMELALNETENSIETKRNVWANWHNSKKYLSELFGYDIKAYGFMPLSEGEDKWEHF